MVTLDDLLKKLDFVLKPRNIKLLRLERDLTLMQPAFVLVYGRNGYANHLTVAEDALEDLELLDGLAGLMDMDLEELEAMGHSGTP